MVKKKKKKKILHKKKKKKNQIKSNQIKQGLWWLCCQNFFERNENEENKGSSLPSQNKRDPLHHFTGNVISNNLSPLHHF